MATNEPCGCAGPKLIFACSGAADVGAIADQAARKLTRDGAGKMFCLAGIGGRVEPILKTTQSASAILAIDGCPTNCVQHCLEQAGFQEFHHIELSEMGLEKGKSPVTNENIERVSQAGAEKLSA
jgi:uncharacterized metal-binding protein